VEEREKESQGVEARLNEINSTTAEQTVKAVGLSKKMLANRFLNETFLQEFSTIHKMKC